MGVLNTETDEFSTVSTGMTGSAKYAGAIAIGSIVYFGPYEADNIGVLDTATNGFCRLQIPATRRSGESKYKGAAAVGTNVYLVPFSEDNVVRPRESRTHDLPLLPMSNASACRLRRACFVPRARLRPVTPWPSFLLVLTTRRQLAC